MPRPSERTVEFWLVFGAALSSIATAITGFEHENRVTLIGIGSPVIRALLMWALAIAAQAAVWWLWTVARKKPPKG